MAAFGAAAAFVAGSSSDSGSGLLVFSAPSTREAPFLAASGLALPAPESDLRGVGAGGSATLTFRFGAGVPSVGAFFAEFVWAVAGNTLAHASRHANKMEQHALVTAGRGMLGGWHI